LNQFRTLNAITLINKFRVQAGKRLFWVNIYGVPLWGAASNSNIEILQSYQNKVLRATVNAPRYISNKVLLTDLKVPKIREEITKFSVKYRDKITTHPNELASTLLEEEEPRRVKRFKPTDLTTRFS
jgi:hypothetical protein